MTRRPTSPVSALLAILAAVLGGACAAEPAPPADATLAPDATAPADAAPADARPDAVSDGGSDAADGARGADAADARRADGGSETADAGYAPAALDPAATAADIERIVRQLAAPEFEGREEGTPGGIAARNFVAAEWTRCGVAPLTPDGFEQPIVTGAGANLLGVIAGRDPALAERFVLVSAHYDHLGVQDGVLHPGAYDNAAAVAIVAQVACALAADPPPRSVLLAAWDAEEPPTVRTEKMGSNFFVANPPLPLAQIDVAVVLDLTGVGLWPGYDGYFALGGETASAVAAALATAAAPDGLTVWRGGLHLVEEQAFGHHAWSDYDGFRNAAVPVLFLSDGQTKVYHEPEDTPEGIDWPKAAREAQFLLNLTATLATARETPQFALQDNYRLDATMVVGVLEAALASGGALDAFAVDADNRALVEADYAAVIAVAARLEAGAEATADDIAALRTGVQRMMCLCSPLNAMLCRVL